MTGFSQQQLDGILEGCFAMPGNSLSWDSFKSGKSELQKLVRDSFRPPVSILFLPRMADGRFSWYCVATTDRSLREAREQIISFVGPTYSDFDGKPTELDLKDGFEACISQFSEGRVYRFSVTHEKVASENLKRAVARLLRTRQSTEHVQRRQPISTGRLLADFDQALVDGDRALASEILRQLESQRLVDEVNVAFMRVLFHAAFKEWSVVAALELAEPLSDFQRPLSVTRALLLSIYHAYLLEYEQKDDVAGAQYVMETAVLPRFQRLFDDRAGLRDSEIVKSFMLAATMAPQRPNVRDDLLGLGFSGTWLEQLASLIPQTASEPTLKQAKEALEDSELDEAASIAKKLEPSVEQAQVLIDRAALSGSLQAEADAFEAVRELGKVPDLDAPVLCWTDWLRRAADPSWPEQRARKSYQDGSLLWAVEDIANEPEAFLSALNLALSTEVGISRLEKAFPKLVQALQGLTGAKEVFTDLRSAQLSYLFSGNRAGMASLRDLCEGALVSGLSETGYKTLLRDLGEAPLSLLSTVNLDGWLDLLAVLLDHPSPLLDGRAGLARSVLGSVASWVAEDRLDAGTAVYAEVLSRWYGFGDAVSSSALDDPLRGLPKSVGIYSLDEPAARRAVDILEIRAPQATVKVNHDKVATKALTHLAKTSDVFVLVTQKAKHAASEEAERVRPGDRPILYPEGKGTTAIIRCLVEFASGQG